MTNFLIYALFAGCRLLYQSFTLNIFEKFKISLSESSDGKLAEGIFKNNSCSLKRHFLPGSKLENSFTGCSLHGFPYNTDFRLLVLLVHELKITSYGAWMTL